MELALKTASPYAWFPAMFIAGTAEYKASDAGYPNGVLVPTISILYNTDDNHKVIAEAQFKENLDIEATLVNQEWATYNANRDTHNYELARAGWGRRPTGSAMNDVGYSALIEKASSMTGYAVLHEAENMLFRASGNHTALLLCSAASCRLCKMGRMGKHSDGLPSDQVHLQK